MSAAPLPNRYLAALWLAAALANTRTPEAGAAQLASGKARALLAGIEPRAIDDALSDIRATLDAIDRRDPAGINARSSTPPAVERRARHQREARDEVLATVDLLGDAPALTARPEPGSLAAHEATKAANRSSLAGMAKLAGGRTS